jgi:hypothetical protein
MKLVGILGFGALLVVVFGYATIFGGPVTTEIIPASTIQTESVDTEQQQKATKREAFAGTGSIESLYERGEALECQIIYTPNLVEAEITGNIFISEGNVRADFVVPSADMTGQTVASIIYDSTTLYLWSEIEGETFGVKQAQTEFAGFADSAAVIEYATEVQYDCLTWLVVDNTIFEPPTDVLFGDMTDVGANMEFGTIYENEREF